MAQKKRKVDPKTKQKEQIAAKRRHRSPKHTATGGQFAPGRINSGTHGQPQGLRVFNLRHPFQGFQPQFMEFSGEHPAAKKGREGVEKRKQERHESFGKDKVTETRLYEQEARRKKASEQSSPGNFIREARKQSGAKKDQETRRRVNSRVDDALSATQQRQAAEAGASGQENARNRKKKTREDHNILSDKELNELMRNIEPDTSKDREDPDIGDLAGYDAGKKRESLAILFESTRNRVAGKYGDRLTKDEIEDVAKQLTMAKLKGRVAISDSELDAAIGTPNLRTRAMDSTDIRTRQGRNFMTEAGSFPGSSPLVSNRNLTSQEIADAPKSREARQMADPYEVQWLIQQRRDPRSQFYADPAGGAQAMRYSRDQENRYWAERYNGRSGGHAMEQLGQERRGRPAQAGKDAQGRDLPSEELAKKVQENKRHPSRNGMQSKTSSVKDSNFGYGIQAPGIDSFDALQRRYPHWTDADIVKFQTMQREYSLGSLSKEGERWGHEARQSRREINLGSKTAGSTEAGKQDRVVFFTTSAGFPAPSVPANSLLGQYVIKKRKKMVQQDWRLPKSQLKGKFPNAVRDQHLVELSTGISFGVEGKYGLFNNTGWKAGSKRSKGYGKPTPLASTILRDGNGQPVYDDKGNVRYTEGYTRPFRQGTDNLGFRIFIG